MIPWVPIMRNFSIFYTLHSVSGPHDKNEAFCHDNIDLDYGAAFVGQQTKVLMLADVLRSCDSPSKRPKLVCPQDESFVFHVSSDGPVQMHLQA